ncbi:MAG: OsmC family protein [Planctomycetes bacterium]|nr:OsmC family protein [Planctomycetota bacterium]
MAKSQTREKSWTYKNTVEWKEGRKGVLSSEGKPDLEVATPADFRGPEGVWSPEDFLVAAVNSCIMTTFLYYQIKAEIKFLSYRSTGQGKVVYGMDGLTFTEITIEAEVTVASQEDVESVRENLELAEKNCLISNALEFEVAMVPKIKLKTDGEG